YRARTTAGEIESTEYAALADDLRSAESEVARYETMVAEAARKRKGSNLPAAAPQSSWPPKPVADDLAPSDTPSDPPGEARTSRGASGNGGAARDPLNTEPPPREPPLT
ncbi:MAG TPA: hypothetical protein VGN65_12360, partial [Casimicrobiaceae bacterium]